MHQSVGWLKSLSCLRRLTIRNMFMHNPPAVISLSPNQGEVLEDLSSLARFQLAVTRHLSGVLVALPSFW